MLEKIWPGVVVVDNVVYQAVAQLRKTLGDDARVPRYIETVPRRGYRLISSVGAARSARAAAEEIARAVESTVRFRSIAVLRFADMSQEQDQEPLCEGIAEEILNRLARIGDLKVIARTSSFQFDRSNVSIREIGRRLGVHHVLEGSGSTTVTQVRISAPFDRV